MGKAAILLDKIDAHAPAELRREVSGGGQAGFGLTSNRACPARAHEHAVRVGAGRVVMIPTAYLRGQRGQRWLGSLSLASMSMMRDGDGQTLCSDPRVRPTTATATATDPHSTRPTLLSRAGKEASRAKFSLGFDSGWS
jgi:hypothetical protein